MRSEPRPHGEDARGASGEESLGDSFWSLARRLRRTSQDALSRWDVTPSQVRVLRVLTRHGAMRLSDLSEHLGIAARSTTEVVDGLQAKDLVRRRADPADRRATLVELTEQGDSVSADIRSARGAGAELIFDRLSATDRAQLARILRKLRDQAD